MARHRTTPDANRLLLEGSLALAEASANGVRIDRDYLERAIAESTAELREHEEAIRRDPAYRAWQRRFGDKANIGSPAQMAAVVFGELGYKARTQTASGDRDSAEEAAFEGIDLPLVKNYFAAQKLRKGRDTYLEGIRREMVSHDGGKTWFVHPNFNLNRVSTFRSSSDSPNYQNVPARNPKLAEIIRRCYISRPGFQLGEIDFGQIEVRIPCPYTFDPVLMDYVNDPTKDMHRDMAAQLFKLKPKQVSKATRQLVKGAYVFATFYGSYWGLTARDLWEQAEFQKLTVEGSVVPDGVDAAGNPKTRPLTVREHLADLGYTELGLSDDKDAEPPVGTFAAHVKDVDGDFWGRRFQVYAQWKRDWWAAYQRDGGFTMLTGFAVHHPLDKKQVCNSPIQGCLPGTSRVQTDRGWIPIRDLVGVVAKVWTGFRWADGIGISRGKCRRASVRLSSGLVIECDTRHKFKNASDVWVNFSDLKPGDAVALPRCQSPVQPSADVNWAFVLGVMVGDGHFNDRRGSVAVVGGEGKKEMLLRIRRFLVDQGFKDGGSYRGIRWREVAPSGGRTETRYILSLQDVRMAKMLRDFGVDLNWRAKTKRVPEFVWRASRQHQRDFLEGLWRTDGSRSTRRLNMANAALLRDVQVLAYGVGFDSHLRTDGRGDGGGWLRFHIKHPHAIWDRKYPMSALVSKVPTIQSRLYAVRNEYIADLAAHSIGEVSQFKAERMLDRAGVSDGVYRYDTVVSITVREEEEETFTMSVNDNLHQFVADGVITKNSAFHCTLWSMIKLMKWLKRYKMRSKVIGEIHDSINLDLHPAERDDVFHAARHIMCEAIKDWAPWLNVPLVTEAEACPIDGCWYDKHALVDKGGVFVPADMAKWEKRHGSWV